MTKHLAIGQSATDQLVLTENQAIEKSQSLTDQFILPATAHTESPVLVDSFCIFNKLSFTHLVALLPITNPLERAFYETMAIKGTWSSRELERQIDSNYFIRTGWSKQPEQLVNIVQGKAEIATLPMDIKSPFVFEFLGLKAKDVVRVKGINPKYWLFDEYNYQRLDDDDELVYLLSNFDDVDFDRYFTF